MNPQQNMVFGGAANPQMGMMPGMMNPNMMNPGMMNPGMMNPGMMNPGMMNPGMMNSGMMMQPGMMNSGMMNPGMMNSGMMNPGMMNPGMMMQPGMMQQGMMQQGMMQPGMMTLGMFNQDTSGTIQKDTPIPEDNNFSNNEINVIFRLVGFKEGTSDTPIILRCHLQDKISDIIENYKTRSQNKDENNKNMVMNLIEIIRVK